jgi:peptidoglycan/LPS O-acetylase OafA/YrhL
MEVATEAGAAPRLGYRPALDGVRAFAIVAVIAFHAQWPGGGGGYLGVDVFFALSGFLITTLLVEERRRHGGVDLRGFWLRRALRLLPALGLLLVGTAVYAAARPSAPASEGFGADALAALFYVANWAAALSHQYHAHLLSHTWSLAIEEQFYVLWPPVLVVLLARTRARTVIAVTAAGVAASVAVRAVLYRSHGFTPRVTYGLDTRASALLLGCLLALFMARRPVRAATRRPTAVTAATGAVGLGVLAWMVVGSRYASASIGAHPGRVFDEAYLLAPLAACALIASLVVAPSTPLARAMSLRPIVWLGRISYSLYLWHFPVDLVLAPAGGATATPALQVARLVVAVVLAAASYELVERRFLALKARTHRRHVPDGAPTAVVVAPVGR